MRFVVAFAVRFIRDVSAAADAATAKSNATIPIPLSHVLYALYQDGRRESGIETRVLGSWEEKRIYMYAYMHVCVYVCVVCASARGLGDG